VAFMHEVTLDFSRPSKPTDNAFIERFNGKFRGECLNTSCSPASTRRRENAEAWRREYNKVRPHSAIGNQVPAALHRTIGNAGQQAAR
jgi:putative transposase